MSSVSSHFFIIIILSEFGKWYHLKTWLIFNLDHHWSWVSWLDCDSQDVFHLFIYSHFICWVLWENAARVSCGNDLTLCQRFCWTTPIDIASLTLPYLVSITCMVSIRVQVTTIKAWMCVILIQGLSLPEVDPWIVFPQPVAVLHRCLPGSVYQLEVTSTWNTPVVTTYPSRLHMVDSLHAKLYKKHRSITASKLDVYTAHADGFDCSSTRDDLYITKEPTWGSTNHLFSLPPPLLGWK